MKLGYRSIRVDSWRGWVHGDWAASLTGGDPLDRLLDWPHEKIHQRELSCTWRVDAPGQTLFAKYVTTSGRRGVDTGSAEERIKQFFRPSVAARALRVSRRMSGGGVRVPTTILATTLRRGLRRDDLIVSTAAEGTSLAEVFLHRSHDEATHGLFDLAGRRVAELHRTGFIHGHLLPGHLYVAADQNTVTFIDNDETYWRPAMARWPGRVWNLTQFVHRLIGHPQYPHADGLALRFLDAYFVRMGFSPASRRRWGGRVLNTARRRARKRLGRPIPAVSPAPLEKPNNATAFRAVAQADPTPAAHG